MVTPPTMRYFATWKGRPEPVVLDIEERAGGGYTLQVDGQKLDVDALPTGAATLSVLLDGQSYDIELDENPAGVHVSVRGHTFLFDVLDERRRRMRQATGGFTVEGRQVIQAPMPGKVVKVLVTLGQQVQEGQGLVVVEAMKMENELKSPKAGKVVELHAKEGTTVENNAKLVVVE